MNLFGKKKEEEFDEEQDIEKEELENKKLKRKLRDLQSENRKTRKEPIKPWGKKERYVVGGFFVITTLAAALMLFLSRDYKFPGIPRITFKEIDIGNLFGEEVIQIGQKSNSQKNDSKAQKAISYFNNETKPLPGHYGFFVVRGGSGEGYGVSSTEKFQGASLIKLPLMIFSYKLNEQGDIDLDTKYVLKEGDKVKGSGVLYSAPNGTSYTYRELVKYMGKSSDRTAYKVMKDVVGEKKLRDYVKEIGMENTDIVTGETTPGDFGLVLNKLWSGDLINTKDRDELLSYLTDTAYESWITVGVPKDVRVAHKFGQDNGVVGDAGIVFAESPYILVVMGRGISADDANKLFPRISKTVFDLETNKP